MTDARTLADMAALNLDRLGAVILDDVGDGPPLDQLRESATAARDAVAQLGVAALTQLTGLILGVSDSIAAGRVDWSPSIGGTMMAAVDDLRHLVGRAAQFSDEDGEHLHHRAAELSVFVRVGDAPQGAPADDASPAATIGEESRRSAAGGDSRSATTANETRGSADVAAEAPGVRAPGEQHLAGTDRDGPTAAPQVTAQPEPAAPSSPHERIVPIAELFFSDAGPHVVRGGTPEAAAARSDLLGRGIDALDSLVSTPFAAATAHAATQVVPVETLLYRGRAALQRAAELRAEIRAAGGTAPPEKLDELYDLIGLALES